MASITSRQFLSIYTVKVRKKHSDYLSFEEMTRDKNCGDFFLIVHEFLKNLNTVVCNDPDKDSVIGVEHLSPEPVKRRLSGMIKSGVYGVEGTLHNVKKSSEKKIKKEDAPLYNYFFSFYIPKNGHEGVLVLHSRGNHGCKTQLDYAIRKFIENEGHSLTVELTPTTVDFKDGHKKLYKNFSVKKLSVTEYRQKSNETSLVSGKKIAPTVVIKRSVEVGRNLNSLFEFNELQSDEKGSSVSKKHFKQYLGIDVSKDADFQVTVEMDGQQKTMNLQQVMKFQMSFDITNEFDDYNRKDPTYTKLKDVCESYLKHAIENIVD